MFWDYLQIPGYLSWFHDILLFLKPGSLNNSIHPFIYLSLSDAGYSKEALLNKTYMLCGLSTSILDSFAPFRCCKSNLNNSLLFLKPGSSKNSTNPLIHLTLSHIGRSREALLNKVDMQPSGVRDYPQAYLVPPHTSLAAKKKEEKIINGDSEVKNVGLRLLDYRNFPFTTATTSRFYAWQDNARFTIDDHELIEVCLNGKIKLTAETKLNIHCFRDWLPISKRLDLQCQAIKYPPLYTSKLYQEWFTISMLMQDITEHMLVWSIQCTSTSCQNNLLFTLDIVRLAS